MIVLIILLCIIYFAYQIIRTNKVHIIRMKWLRDERGQWYRHSTKSMLSPSISNWFGLKFPNEKDFK